VKCLDCSILFFNFYDEVKLEDLFCEDCPADEAKLSEANTSEAHYFGNIIGWELKSDSQEKRSRYNYNKVYKRDNYTCQYCDYSVLNSGEFRPLHIDHIRPFVARGSNSLDNMVVACSRCNLKVGSKWFGSFEEKKSYILSQI
jgi:5-methylcytosine-specific restriction endonuclease McrA